MGTSILSRVKQITSPGWMHEISAQGWCTGKTQRDGMEREVGGGIRKGNTFKSMADSCQCMANTTKKKNHHKIKSLGISKKIRLGKVGKFLIFWKGNRAVLMVKES